MPKSKNSMRAFAHSRVLDFFYRPGLQRSMRIFHAEKGLPARPIMAVANAVFQLEKILRKTRVDEVRIALSTNHLARPARRSIPLALTELVSYVLLEEVTFTMTESAPPKPKRIRTSVDLRPARAICLFSGGVDSLVGLSQAAERFPDLNAVFCAHSDQAHAIRIVKNLESSVLQPRGVPLRKVYVPPIEKQGYAQTRGFLYILMAAAWMKLLEASTLVVTEVGPTMYQPKFAPFDVVTLTTHPFVVESARFVLEHFLGRPIKILTPFENLTKAEIFTLAPPGLGIGMTHSCISQRFGDHDGTCYGCVVRRLASIASRRRDVSYRRNPLVDPIATRGNLLALLRFNLDFLRDPYRMEQFEVGDIFSYGKRDLFRRFALDNFSAIHLLVKRHAPVASDVKEIYRSAVSILEGTQPLEDRLAVLSAGAFAPSF
jgi:7-cyano-7-deazaguanine synthase in queuosine biosynthesis